MCRMNISDLNYLTCTMRSHMGDYQAILRITQNKLTCAKKYCGRKKWNEYFLNVYIFLMDL